MKYQIECHLALLIILLLFPNVTNQFLFLLEYNKCISSGRARIFRFRPILQIKSEDKINSRLTESQSK